jgi:hypothetical protein
MRPSSPLYLALRQQERYADAIAVLRAAGIEAESIGTLVREQIKARGGSFQSVEVSAKGDCRVNMRFIRSIPSPDCVEGLPITWLSVQGCRERFPTSNRYGAWRWSSSMSVVQPSPISRRSKACPWNTLISLAAASSRT